MKFNYTWKNTAGEITNAGTVESSTLRGACSKAGAFGMRKIAEGCYVSVCRHNPAKYRPNSPERKEAQEKLANWSPVSLEVVAA